MVIARVLSLVQVCTEVFSVNIFDMYMLGSSFLVFDKLASLSCLLSGALNAKKKMLHGFSPHSSIPSAVSTHLKP